MEIKSDCRYMPFLIMEAAVVVLLALLLGTIFLAGYLIESKFKSDINFDKNASLGYFLGGFGGGILFLSVFFYLLNSRPWWVAGIAGGASYFCSFILGEYMGKGSIDWGRHLGTFVGLSLGFILASFIA